MLPATGYIFPHPTQPHLGVSQLSNALLSPSIYQSLLPPSLLSPQMKMPTWAQWCGMRRSVSWTMNAGTFVASRF